MSGGEASRAAIYALTAFAPLLLLLGRARSQRSSVREFLLFVAPVGAAGGVLALAGGLALTPAAWVTAVLVAYQTVWLGLHRALGSGRVAAAVVALAACLPVAATFAPNACVESPAGQVVVASAPALLVHIDPVITLGHRLLDDPVLVKHYFYHQANALPPHPGRLCLIYVLFAAAGIGMGWRSPKSDGMLVSTGE